MVTRSNPSFTPEHLRFLDYIRAVGTGPKGNRPLSYEEAKDAFSLILNRQIPDTLITPFLLGWRVQGEGDEELQACVDYLAKQAQSARAHCRSEPSANVVNGGSTPMTFSSVEIGYPMDGKAKFPPIMLKAAALLKELSIHATYDLPLGPKYGFQSHQFSPFTSNVILHDRTELFPELSALTDLRNSIGIRSAFSTLEKLHFLAPVALIGMHHAPYFDLYSTLYQNHYRRLIIVQGHEGTPEVLKKTKYKLLQNGEVTTQYIDPEAFGIAPISAKEEIPLDQMIQLMNNPDENLAKMIRLNAAFIGFAANIYTSVEEGYQCLQG